jgi:hypothetical protein
MKINSKIMSKTPKSGVKTSKLKFRVKICGV